MTHIDVTAAPYGADKTGGSDAAPAIQSAIDAAAASPDTRTVHFPLGTYRLDSALSLKRGVTLLGDGTSLSGGAHCAMLRPGPGVALDPMLTIDEHWASVVNLAFDLSYVALSAILMRGNFLSVLDCYLKQSPVSSSSSMIKIGGSMYPRIAGCTFGVVSGWAIDAQKAYNASSALYFAVNAGTVERCTFSGGRPPPGGDGGCEGAIRFWGGLDIWGCRAEIKMRGAAGDQRGAFFVDSTHGVSHSSIHGNYFELDSGGIGIMPPNAIYLKGGGHARVERNTAHGSGAGGAFVEMTSAQFGLSVVDNYADGFPTAIGHYARNNLGSASIHGNSGTSFCGTATTVPNPFGTDPAYWPSNGVSANTAGIPSMFVNAGPHTAVMPQLSLPYCTHHPNHYPSLATNPNRTLNFRLGNLHTFNSFHLSPIVFSEVMNPMKGCLYLLFCRDGGVTLLHSKFKLVEGKDVTMGAGECRLFQVDANGALQEISLSSALIAKSPNGTVYRIKVDDAGNLSATPV